MGKAFLRGALNAGVISPDHTFIYDVHPQATADLKVDFNLQETLSVFELIAKTNVVLIAVKPKDLPDVLRIIHRGGGENHLIISVAAGITLRNILDLTGNYARIARIMPNTPCMLGVGASAYCVSPNATPADSAFVHKLAEASGLALPVEESLMDAVTGLSGSGPAYMFTMIEALADAGVLHGLPRDHAVKLAAQTMLGAATMVLRTGMHPGVLRDQVTSPGGTTIAGLAELERNGLRSALIQAVDAAVHRAQAIGAESARKHAREETTGTASSSPAV